jgi:hypothetical protein
LKLKKRERERLLCHSFLLAFAASASENLSGFEFTVKVAGTSAQVTRKASYV